MKKEKPIIWLNIANSAKELGVSVPTIHRWIKSEENKAKLRAKQIGRQWFLPLDVVHGILDGKIVITFGGGK